jgi:glycosyltransferase involved in cell wall biosynthesis
MEWWFGVYLRTAELMGYAIVWTAHDLLPHDQIFADDARARDLLLDKAKGIIALSEATASELRALGGRDVRVIPIGPYSDPRAISLSKETARASFGFNCDDIVMALVGRIEEYKGADLLLLAAAQLPSTSNIKVLLAGVCPDLSYRRELDQLASDIGGKVILKFEFVPEEDLERYFRAIDFAVFPFREITNSASVVLAQSFGRPIIIPNLPALADIPEASAIRFKPGVESLVAALEQAEHLSDDEHRDMGASGLAWAHRSNWSDVAQETIETYREVRLC